MVFVAVSTPIILPWPLRSGLEAAVRALLEPGDRPPIDFSKPVGEPALVSPESVSWRVFKNPLSLFIGGVTAVIMELAEPRVRTGVWEHTTFRLNPIKRLSRTGLAAMVTIYGARSTAEAMIASVRRVHDRIVGTTPSGEPYCANDLQLLNWVQGTAAYGFLHAYHAYVQPLLSSERDRYYAEGVSAAALYGARRVRRNLRLSWSICFKRCAAAWSAQTLCLSFSQSCARRPFYRCCYGPAQRLLVRAAVNLTPRWARTILGLEGDSLYPWEAEVVRQAGALADRIVLNSNPAVQACQRMGLPPDYLYVRREAVTENASPFQQVT
jgi:uncharacterized protein (DUF2236 family)